MKSGVSSIRDVRNEAHLANETLRVPEAKT